MLSNCLPYPREQTVENTLAIINSDFRVNLLI